MKKQYNVIILIILSLVVVGALPAQAAFQFSLQSWGSYTTYDHPAVTTAQSYAFNTSTGAIYTIPAGTVDAYKSTQLGFGIRRARLRGKMSHGPATAFVQFEAAGTPTLLDARLDYDFSDNLKLSMGRFIGAGSQAGGRTGHTSIDFIERSIVARNWASALGRSDYRTYGMSVAGKISQFKYEVTAHNGSGSLNFKPYNSSSSGSGTDTGTLPQLDFMGEMKLGDAISTGLHFGPANEDRINKSSWTGFAYYTPKVYQKGGIRGKIDFARVADAATDITQSGIALLGAYKICDKIEVGGRYETWDVNTDADDDAVANISLGLNYAPDPEHWMDTLFKLGLTYKTAQGSDPVDPLTIHFMWQMYLH
ncbi:MAG: hypothetical protein ABIA75_01115 [Candidatus Neomarinimicrobiota bacterium]